MDTKLQKIDEKQADNKAQGTAGIIGGTNDGPSKEASMGAPMSDDGNRLKVEATPKAVKSNVVPQLDPTIVLIAKAQELNIEVDADWNEDRLRAEIQMAMEGRADLQVKGAVPPAEYGDVDYDPATKKNKDDVQVELTADYWPRADQRVSAGTPVWMSRAEAKKLIAADKARRVDDL